MGLTAKDPGGKQFDPIPQAVHIAVCYSVVDVGTHLDQQFGKRHHSCMITWEIPGERITIEKDGEKKELPRAISKKYTISLHEKATLRKDLQTWRGRVFSEEELKGFDIKNLLGKSCMIQVLHAKSGEKTYANVSAIMPLMKGTAPVVPENPLIFYSLEDHGADIPAGIPDWVKDLIKTSDEWQMIPSPEMSHEPPTDDVPPGTYEDVPF